MIIPELNPYEGTPAAEDVLAIDDGTETFKIGAGDLVKSFLGARIWYGTSSTIATTSAKVVTCSGFTLKTGETIAVKFTNTSTTKSITLNVNGTGAKAVKVTSGSTESLAGLWRAGEVVLFTYDGTNWLVDSSSRSGVIAFTSSNISSLPVTITDSNITTKHVVLNSVLSNPAAQTSDWTVTTNNGSLTIAGTISGTTDITLVLGYQTN